VTQTPPYEQPPVGTPTAAATSPTVTTTPILPTAPPESDERLRPAAQREPARHAGRPLSTTLVEAGLLSAAVLGTLDTFRRRQAQHRPAGRRIRLPGRRLADTERALRIGGQQHRMGVVDRATQRLVADLRRGAMPAATVLAVVAGPSSLEVLIERPLPPPPPWTSSGQGFRWRIPTNQLPAAAPDGSAPMPALAPVGRASDDGADILLNLEAAGVLFVSGDPERAAGVVRALATSISGLMWTHAANLVLVGFGAQLRPVDRVRSVAAIGEVIEELRSTAELMGRLTGRADPFPARVQQRAGDGWAPTIVCCPGPLDPVERAEVVRLARPGNGLVAVLAGPAGPDTWTIDVDSEPMTVQPLRLSLDPTVLDAGDLDDIGQLYQLALDDSGSARDDPPYDELAISAEHPVPPPADEAETERIHGGRALSADRGHVSVSAVAHTNGDARPGGRGDKATTPATPLASPPPPPAVLVRVLGTVELDGAATFRRAKSRELAVYLAMHPNGVGEAELDEAMWPSDGSRLVSASTRDSTVSVARTALGGPTRLLPAQGHGREKRYQLSDAVDTDWAAFCALHRKGRAVEDTGPLCAALEMVRGRPFEGVIAARTYGWVHTEGHARHIEAEVADAADLAASLLLGAGRALDARWAARRGLLADPYIERLWVRLMEAADLLGESQEIERIMDEMDVVLELDGDFSGLHPNTLAVYERLSRRHRLAT
jgi:DNA-binding SARP family transcriptional activator